MIDITDLLFIMIYVNLAICEFGILACWWYVVLHKFNYVSLPKIINPHQGINAGLRQRCPVVVVIICKFERENVKKRGHICGSS
jgi:hypothetical protein